MFELFSYTFIQNAFMAGVLASVICGIIGVFVILKRIVFISGGLAHFSFSGIGFGYLIEVNPMFPTLVFSLIAAVAIGLLKKRVNMQEDSTIGMLWAVGMALGILFIGLSKGYAVDLFSYLFGNILAVTTRDLTIMAVLSALILVIVVFLYKELLLLTFDEKYGEVVGAPMDATYITLLCLIALSIVVMIKIVGVILVIALLTIPASASKLFSDNIKTMILVSITIGIFSSCAGLMISYYADLASGATIVLVSGLVFSILSIARYVRERVAEKRMVMG